MRPLFVALIVTTVAAGASAASGATFEPISGTAYEGVLVPQERAAEFWHLQGLDVPPAGFWTPGRAEVEAFEASLPEFLEDAAAMNGPNLAPKLSEYRRQYVGILVGGQKVLYVNFVCTSAVQEHFPDWQNKPVQVEDGGSCFFQTEFDMATRKFLHLKVNGEA